MNQQQLGFGWEEPAGESGGRDGDAKKAKPRSAQGGSAKAGGPPKADRITILPTIAPLADKLERLSRRGTHLGTSSWKYPGWLGTVYDPARYTTRGKLSERRFQQTCIEEYARIFPTVGGDFSFYQFPSQDYWDRLFAQVPEGFTFGLKIPEDLTVSKFPKHKRYGRRAGQVNESFMDAGRLQRELLDRLAPHRHKIGVLMFEFGQIYGKPLSEGDAFAERLGRMLEAIPTGEFRFAVEIRNKRFLDGPGGEANPYLACLRQHGVAHVLNSWTRMPSLLEQLAVPGIFTAGHAAARLLLQPGRSYAQAVDMFSPYEAVQEEYPDGRDALHELIERNLAEQRMIFAFVNNRFEGNAVGTIDGVLGGMDLPAEDTAN